jgi:hypothetical protein
VTAETGGHRASQRGGPSSSLRELILIVGHQAQDLVSQAAAKAETGQGEYKGGQ